MSDYWPEERMPLFDAAPRTAEAPPRTAGGEAAAACAEKAERVAGFHTAAAKTAILDALRTSRLAISGEELTDHCMRNGIVPHDARAFGAVFQSLARDGLIETVGFCPRAKGHWTAGGRLWRITGKGATDGR